MHEPSQNGEGRRSPKVTPMGPCNGRRIDNDKKTTKRRRNRETHKAKWWPETVEFAPRAQVRAAGSGQKQKHKQTCARRLQVRSNNSGQLTCPSLTIGQGRETKNQTTIQQEHKVAHKGFFFRMELFRPCPENGIIIVMFFFFFRFWGCPVPGCLTRHGYVKHRVCFFWTIPNARRA